MNTTVIATTHTGHQERIDVEFCISKIRLGPVVIESFGPTPETKRILATYKTWEVVNHD